jgi:HD-GYP domain-containing protein (c-di-GMP phosphodiesterase class II)
MSVTPGEAHRILLAGPSDGACEGIGAALRQAGYSCLRAATGPEAISLFCVETPPVVLIDVDLPGGGMLVCRDLFETEAIGDTVVLMLLPDNERATREAAFAAGAHDAFPRDCGREELLGRVAYALHGWAVSADLRVRNLDLRQRVDRGLGELDRVNRNLKQQLRQQQTLLELTQEMAASLEATQQANVLLLSIVGQVGALSAALFAGDGEGAPMSLIAVKGIDREACLAVSEADRAGWRDWLESAGATPLEGIVPAELAALGFALMVPIRDRARIGGAVALGPRITGQPYSAGDIRMLETMGNSFAIALQNSNLYIQLQRTYVNTIEALVTAIEAKDRYTRGHTARVAKYARALAVELDLDEAALQQVEYGAALHDVGKIGIYEHVLNKHGELTEEEFAMIRRHPAMGDRILAHIDFLREARLAVRHHHERVDGTGYPDGLRGAQIPLIAKIVAVADAFDAMTTTRTYSNPISLEEAIGHLEHKSGSQFDVMVVNAFVRLLRDGRLRLGRLAAPDPQAAAAPFA